MSLSEKIKKELENWLDIFWQTYLRGDITTLSTFMRDDYYNIGGTKEEIWHSKQEILDYTYSILDQMVGKVEIRNRKIDVLPFGDYVMVNEFTDLYVKTDNEWSLYGPFRMSSLLEQTKDGWLALHQHGSYPDMKATEGEAFSVDALKAENLKLQKGIKRRTSQLEQKNHELEIEAALERVRSRSIGMQKSEELKDVIKIVYQQLTHLKINLKHSGFVVDYTPKGDWHFWIADEQDIPSKITTPYFESVWANQFNEAKEKGTDFFTTSLNFEEKNKFYNELLSFIPELPQAAKDFYLNCPGLAASTVLLDTIGLYIENFEGIPYTKEENNILMRFGKVFQQTYTRFLDLQKAEAQAREAQIETALEKVRSRSLAMHKSDELNEVVSILFEKLKELQIPATAVGIGIGIDGSKDLNSFVCGENEDGLVITNYRLPYFNNKISIDLSNALEKQLDFFVGHYSKEEKNAFYKYLIEHAAEFKNLPEDIKRMIFDSPSYTISMVAVNNAIFNINDFEGTILSDNEVDIIKRFAKVFDQAYTRFMDLQKSEAQAREAQIELGLERVRARAMAMQNSNELSDLVGTLMNELTKLDFSLQMCIINIINEKDNSNMVWASNPNEENPDSYYLKFEDYPFHHAMMKAYKEQKLKYVYTIEGEEKVIYDAYLFRETEFNRFSKKDQKAFRAVSKYVCSFTFSNFGGLQTIGDERLTSENLDILARFGKVFDQTYTRFLDLQKAEAQAREAKVEGALERVRSKTMAMHNSKDLEDIVISLFDEVLNLGIDKSIRCGIGILEDHEGMETRSANSNPDGTVELRVGMLNMTIHPMLVGLKKAWEKGRKGYSYNYIGKDVRNYYEALNNEPEYPFNANLETLPEREFHQSFFYSSGILFAFSENPISEESSKILARFASVFGQTYRRFLDLQKAEAQVRESQIEAALERTRTQSMLMQHSDELNVTAQVFHQQLQLLGIDSEFSYLWLPDEVENKYSFWATWSETKKGKTIFNNKTVSFPLDKKELAIAACYIAWESGETVHVNTVQPDAVEDYFTTWKDLLSGVTKFKPKLFPDGLYYVDAYMKYGCFGIMVRGVLSQDEKHILSRFSKEFERTYSRFLGLQKAEAQSRESQIEAALERVRSQSMGMQTTEDFGSVTTEMFNQLRHFGENLFATGIVFCDKQKGHVEQWHSIPGADMLTPFLVPVDLDYIHQYRYDQWKQGTELFSIEIPEDFIQHHFEAMFKLPSAQRVLKDFESQNTPMPSAPSWEIDYGASFKQGYILVSSLQPLQNTDIIPRFAKVFEQAYTRYLDLQLAEARAKEAHIEMALEKVRSRTMAMQKSKELAETSVVVFKQLLDLGIAPNRLFIGLIKEEGKRIESWVTNEDGSKVETQFTMHDSKNKSIQKMVNGWKQNKTSITIDMKGKELQAYFKYLNEEMKMPFKFGLEQKRRVQTIAYFSGGMIGMAASEEQPKETTELLERFASVFNLTYTRFNDLKLAEANAEKAEQDLIKLQVSKKRAEEALSELQSTQKQLIQSEKMASLGELTAGIAHEIQNPLNFVNNFSEVSKELLEEMLEEIENGDMEEVKAIMSDVVQNLEKINHHGTRADGIVKGMLQHSRAGGDKKESTDINALVDEYLRLAYHGLRAKNKAFNAQLVTDFDDTIKTIDIIPQDIGRVILNLLTNAFYATNEKKKLGIEGYNPTVTIGTKKTAKTIEIIVSDNGNGMPDAVKEKIFQPFFTTKPTGQGTGLGLSMSYDIITKGHGGELKVETKESKGTEFSIHLPL